MTCLAMLILGGLTFLGLALGIAGLAVLLRSGSVEEVTGLCSACLVLTPLAVPWVSATRATEMDIFALFLLSSIPPLALVGLAVGTYRWLTEIPPEKPGPRLFPCSSVVLALTAVAVCALFATGGYLVGSQHPEFEGMVVLGHLLGLAFTAVLALVLFAWQRSRDDES